DEGGEVAEHLLRLRDDDALDDLARRGIERNLTGAEEEAVGDPRLRVRPDGGGRPVRVQRLDRHVTSPWWWVCCAPARRRAESISRTPLRQPEESPSIGRGERAEYRAIDATCGGDTRGGERHPRRLVALAAVRDRRQVGRIRLHEKP